jgi:ABC-2 type transport system permease protein
MSRKVTRWKENYIAVYTIIRREIIRFFRIWSQTLLPSVVSIALYFIIFGNLIGPRIGQMEGVSYIEYIVPGLIMMAIITNSYSNVVFSFYISKFQRDIEEMLVSPLPNSLIICGYVLGGVMRGVVVGVLVTAVSLFFTKLQVHNFSFTILVGVLTAILFALLGLLNGISAKKFDDVDIVPTFVLSPLTYLGGVFYSISLLPEFWQKVTYINPIFYMINAFRYGMLELSDVPQGLALSVIIVFIVLSYCLNLWLLNRGVGIKS